ncbi:MAG: hypothetical protein FWE18_05470 [Alphaproteobacteria bacterium]|nr:hypothetical protein [Alphaproteobacteria bacterium]
MFQKKLLMCLYKYFLAGIAIALLTSCSNIFAEHKVYNNIFVNDIAERRGMIIRNTLLEYFPNRDYEATNFVINVETTKASDFYLTAANGFASRNRVSIVVNWNITYKPTNAVLLKITNTYSESFNIEKIGQSNALNEQLTEETIARTIARDIALKTFSLMLKIQENPEIIEQQTAPKKNPDLTENSMEIPTP